MIVGIVTHDSANNEINSALSIAPILGIVARRNSEAVDGQISGAKPKTMSSKADIVD